MQLLRGFAGLLFVGVFLRAALGAVLAGAQLLDDALLLLPAVPGAVMHRRGAGHRSQDVVMNGAAVLLEPISVPRVALEPVLHWGSPVLKPFLLVAAPGAGGALRGVAEPSPAEPQDLLHIKLFLP